MGRLPRLLVLESDCEESWRDKAGVILERDTSEWTGGRRGDVCALPARECEDDVDEAEEYASEPWGLCEEE